MKLSTTFIRSLSLFALTFKCRWAAYAEGDYLDRVIFVGDSDINYWGVQGNSDEFISGSVNLGRNGWTCQDVIEAVDDWLNEYDPTLVVLKCGTNDLWGPNQVPPDGAFDRFTKVIDKISAYGTRVIAMSTKPEIPVLAAGAPAERWQEFNSLVKPYAVEIAQNALPGLAPLQFIDSYEGLLELGNSISFYQPGDIIHLSEEGYSHWNEWVTTAIDALDGDPNCAVWLNNECEEHVPVSTNAPSLSPTASPTLLPTSKPTVTSEDSPTTTPSVSPTRGLRGSDPTYMPSPSPSTRDTTLPSRMPISTPSTEPTSSPTSAPSFMPSTSTSCEDMSRFDCNDTPGCAYYPFARTCDIAASAEFCESLDMRYWWNMFKCATQGCLFNFNKRSPTCSGRWG